LIRLLYTSSGSSPAIEALSLAINAKFFSTVVGNTSFLNLLINPLIRVFSIKLVDFPFVYVQYKSLLYTRPKEQLMLSHKTRLYLHPY